MSVRTGREGVRKRLREAESDGKKRKDMSILRNTHTHTYTHTHAFANELPLVTREEHFVASHSPAAVLVYENICVCVYPSKKKWMSMCVRACVCVCAHPCWPVLTCTAACLPVCPEPQLTCVVSGRPPSPPPSPHPLTPHLGPTRGRRGPPGAGPHGGAEGPPHELRQRGGPLRSRALSDSARSQW